MVTISQLGQAPPASYHPYIHGVYVNLRGRNNIDNADEFQNRASRLARPASSPRSLLAALFAVSAVVFLAYLCSLSIRKRISASFSSRRLAARSGGEENYDSESTCSADSPAEASPEGQSVMLVQLGSAAGDSEGGDMQTQQGSTLPTDPIDTASVSSGLVVSRAANPQPETQRRRTGANRKRKGQPIVEKEAKQSTRGTPFAETPLQPPPPPLDTGLVSVSDSVLLGDEGPLLQDVWLFDAVGSRLPRWGGDSATPFVQTPLQPPPPLFDPELDSPVHSPVFEDIDVLSGDAWLLDDELLHSTPDSSTASMPPALGGSSVGPGAGPAHGNADYVLPSTTSGLQEPSEDRGNEWPLSAGGSGYQMQQGLPAGAGTLHSGPSHGGTPATRGSPQAHTAEAPAASKEGKATSSKATPAGSLPSSSTASSALREPPSEVTPFQGVGSAEQSPSVTGILSDTSAATYFRWLDVLYPGVPDSILEKHPFYRYPDSKPPPSTRCFSVSVAVTASPIQRSAYPLLFECRKIMKKSSLSLEDFENLLFQAERLCGYAMGKMSLSYRANQAMCARETLGVVFLVIDTLYCAAKILGDRSMKELWWPRIMRRIEGVKYIPSAVVPSLTKCIRNLDVARTLSAALEYYRRGERPPPRMVIGLKEALFCEKCPSSKFNQEKWDLWREDVRSWRRHIQLMLAESK